MSRDKETHFEREGWAFDFHPGVLRNIERFLAENKDHERTVEEIFSHLMKVPKDSRWFRIFPKTVDGYPIVVQPGQKIRIAGMVDDVKRIIRLTHFDSHT